jgi:nucleoside-diphosphate-sugar epimerase
MRVCVTGATGFIGGALVRRLLNDGVSVRALARPSRRADALANRVELIRGDLGDSQAVERAVSGVDVVYHAAAKVEGPWTREQFMDTNVEGTRRLFQACKRQNTPHVVYLSSIAVYGPASKDELIDELTPFDSSPEKRDSYSSSKIQADRIASTSEVPVTILRPGMVYGPGRPLPIGLLGFRLGDTNVVFGNPRHRIPLSYVENLIDAILLASNPSGDPVRRYILVDDENLTLEQYHSARRQIEKVRTLFVPGWPLLAGPLIYGSLARIIATGSQNGSIWWRQIRRALENRRYSTERIRDELNWSAKVPLHEAISHTLYATTDNDPS